MNRKTTREQFKLAPIEKHRYKVVKKLIVRLVMPLHTAAVLSRGIVSCARLKAVKLTLG